MMNEELISSDTIQNTLEFIKNFNLDPRILERLARRIDLTNAPHGVSILTDYEIRKLVKRVIMREGNNFTWQSTCL